MPSTAPAVFAIHAPWLWPYGGLWPADSDNLPLQQPAGQAPACHPDLRSDAPGPPGVVSRWLNRLAADLGAGAPRLAAGRLQFVPQTALPQGEAYESFVHRSAQVPSRDNWHDLFNGLVWLAQPALKRRLNELQAGHLAQHGVQPRRGPLRDALTLMDENGALLEAPAPLWTALRQRDWPGLFITHRPLWAQARLRIVGHALLEQLWRAPRKPLTAHVLCADPLALDAAGWAAKPFAPLPVLGVPGWWPANEAPGFYDDTSVFRPARSLQSTGNARPCRS